MYAPIFYLAYVALTATLVLTIALTPLFAMHGPKELAAFSYNAYAPTCHQWIYRSSCVFYNGTSHWISDCIQSGTQPNISTEFTSASRAWDGPFLYSRSQIGRNRAERADYGSFYGYKFPNDDRNIGVYLFMLLSALPLPFLWKKPAIPHPALFLAFVLPLAIDGTGQLLGYWESTNAMRFATGALAGIAVSFFTYAIIFSQKKSKKV